VLEYQQRIGVMLEPLEKFFPDFLTKITKLPTTVRIALAVLILAAPAGYAWVGSYVGRELRIPRKRGLQAILTWCS
jgi:hypothetical protein